MDESLKCGLKVDKLTKMIFVLSLIMILQPSTAADCPHGWVHHDSSCYLFSHEEEQWTHAAILCSSFGGKLAEVETLEENTHLSKVIDLFGHSFWIGLSDVQEEGEWRWMDSKETLTNIGYQNWLPNQPNNQDDNENCARIVSNTTGGWNDFHCTGLLHYICENPSGPYSRIS